MSLRRSPLGESTNSGGNRLKRLVDLVLALVTLPLTLPVMLVIALAIRITSPGPVLMRLSCIGMNGRVFRQYRFRVIRSDLSASHLSGGVDNAACLTPFGALLLPSGLNLLPQVLNVLKGEMSFIGPRAVAVAVTNRRDHPDSRLFAARPGIVSPEAFHPAGHALSESDRLALSLAYASCAGARTDGRLMLQRTARVLRGRG